MRYYFMLFICVSLCDGFPNIADDEEREISSCEKNLCENGGSCITRVEGEKNVFCHCTARYSGKRCEIDKCSLHQCEGNEVCVEENGYVLCVIRNSCASNPCANGGSCIANEGGFTCICAHGYTGENCEIDQCSSLECKENEVCEEVNGDFECKIGDPCTSNPCENEGSCIVNSDLNEGFSCSCADGYSGKICEIDKCDLTRCDENEVCVVVNGYAECKIKDESDDTSEGLATTTPIKVTSTKTITTRKEKNNKTTTSGHSVKTNVTETSKTDQLLSSSSIVTRNTTAFTKAPTKITKTTKNEVATTIRVSRSDLSSTSVEMTSETNTDDHHKHSTVTPSSPSVGNTTSFENNTIKTYHTLTDGLTTIEFATTTDNVFKSSSQTSPKISSYSSTSMSTSASPDNSGYTSERPHVIISTSTESKEKIETMNFKSTGSYASTTETLNNTSATNHNSGNDINRTNASSQTITIYASLGTVCFAVLVAFAVGGWYIRRRYRRRKRQCYTEWDTSSQISRNSDFSYNSP